MLFFYKYPCLYVEVIITPYQWIMSSKDTFSNISTISPDPKKYRIEFTISKAATFKQYQLPIYHPKKFLLKVKKKNSKNNGGLYHFFFFFCIITQITNLKFI